MRTDGRPRFRPAARAALGWAAALGLAALAAFAQGRDELVVWIEEPTGATPALGGVEVHAEARGEGIERVELLVDGEAAGELTAPPYRWLVDVGEANREHVFLVRAHRGAESAEATVTTPSFRVDEAMDVELQELYVTVSSAGQRVLGLRQEDFTITDDGAPQAIATFARGDVRLTATILVDASASMRGRRLELAVAGATAFVEGMTEVDEAALLLFSDRLLHMTPFSSDPGVLTEGLASVPAAGGTALNDHLYLALRRLEEHPGRRVVILLSDGVDGHSALTMRQVQWVAARSRALVYWLRSADLSDPRQQRYSAWKDPQRFREDYLLLADAVTGSGGRIVTLPDPSGTAEAMRGILAELREQYILGYHPDNNRDDGRFHRVRVGVRGAGLEVRARGGYVDD